MAVRHGRSHGGSDHAHLVVGLVAEDGSRASVHNERWRTQQACRELEREFGLRELEARGRGTGERGIKAGELAADGVRGRRVGERQQHPERGSRRTLERIVRACAAAARDEADFVTRLRGEGLLARARYEHGGTSEVAGYSVGLAPRDGERPVWYGGGRLSRELTLPRLRENWPELDARVQSEAWQARASGRGRRTSTGPSTELQAQCARELAKLRDQLREVPIGERGTWAHVARETSGVLAAWSLRTEPQPGPLAQASRSLARSAQLHAGDVRQRRRGHIPPARRTAQLLLAAAVGGSPSSAMLMRELIGLSLAIRDMHAAAGELGRAQELEQTARRELEQVSSLLLGREIREQATGQAGTQRGRSGVESPGAER